MSSGWMPSQAYRDPRSTRFSANSWPARTGRISRRFCEPVELVSGADRPVALSGPDIVPDPGHERHVVDGATRVVVETEHQAPRGPARSGRRQAPARRAAE